MDVLDDTRNVTLPKNETKSKNRTLPISDEAKEETLTKFLNSTNRKRRDTLGSPIFVETAVFVDRDLFDHMKTNFPTDTERELIRFILAMINAVSSSIKC